jgi:proteasome lid subunit RPN8/RPN11
VIAIVQRVLDDVRAHARDADPRECCGILIGTADRVFESVRAGNLADGTTRFELDPRDHFRAIRDARDRHLDVLGFYHSHPRSRAHPSETDVAECSYAEALHLIAGTGDAGDEMRLFRIGRDGVTEVPYVATQSATDEGQRDQTAG